MKEKIKEIIKKTGKFSYLLQFIFMIIFSISLYKLLGIKSYSGYWHLGYLILTGVLGTINIAIIVYNCIKNKDKIEKIFLNFAIPLGILYLTFMIPGQVPDELAHMIRAYDVSNGAIFTKVDEQGNSSIAVPKDLMKYNHEELNKYEQLNQMWNQKTDYNDTIETVSSAQGYSFILYIFPAIGFFIGRICNLNILFGIYIGRILNLLLFCGIGYLTIKKIPLGKIVMALYLLMPMMLHQAVSFSADVMINAIALYFVAYAMFLLLKVEKLEKKHIVIYGILTAILGVAKIAYIPLVGIGILFIGKKTFSKKQKWILITSSILIGLIFSIGSYLITLQYSSETEESRQYNEQLNVNTSEQIKMIFEQPNKIIEAYKTDWLQAGDKYVRMAIGSELGWLTIKPYDFIITTYLILLLSAIVFEKNRFDLKRYQKAWLVLLVIGIICLVELVLYLSFTPVGAEFIGGIQGRYYIPVYILLLLCLINKNYSINIKNANVKMIIISNLLNLGVLYSIYSYFV